MIKTRKIEIIPVGNKKEVLSKVQDIQNICATLANEVARYTVVNLKNLQDFKKENPDLNSETANKKYTEYLGTSLRNYGYRISTKYKDQLPSQIRTSLNSNIYKTIQKNLNNILKNKMSIPSFTSSHMAIYFNYPGTLTKKEEKYHLLVNKQLDLEFTLHFGRDRSNNKSIVDKVLSGEYKGCDSNISTKDGKIFLNLSFDFTPEKNEDLNPDICLGIDMGLNRPVTIARNDGKYVPQIELGPNIMGTRLAFHQQRRMLSRGLTHAKGGHGTKRKLKKFQDLKEKERNYCETMNHKMSKAIIDICKKENIGKIKMEDLTGITKDANDYYLKSWAYYQLESQIKYKADEAGILVEYVNPKDTSKMCNCCGIIQKDARDKEDVTKFVCQTVDCNVFGKIQDADINAAKNISKKHGEPHKAKSKKGRIENWKKKQKSLEENLEV